jgi:putative RNA 2'-phosphotransferase
MDRSRIRTSKYLSFVLRHHPDSIGLQLDDQGWASIDDLIEAARSNGRHLSRPTLLEVVEQCDKQRFTVSPDGQKIRANHGHSVDVDLALEPTVPPEVLYHGTIHGYLASIREAGLKAQRRRHVHLSPDEDTARTVGQRRGSPVVLRVLAGRMHNNGYKFYHSASDVWLTDCVPAEFIEIP